MSKKFIELLKLVLGLIMVDGLLSLFYFWTAMLSYSLWISGSDDAVLLLSWPVAIRLAEVHFHGPNLLVLSIVGIFAPLITFLPITFLASFIKKQHPWLKYSFCVAWIGEIFVLGFFIPRLRLF